MIEVAVTYDFMEPIDQQAYALFAKQAVGVMLKAPGFAEFRAHRNILGSPQVRIVQVWNTLADWARLCESDEWKELDAQFRGFATNIRYEAWGPSPVTPDPIRPGR